MMYTICPCSDDVCRIRFDFTAFTLTGPVTSALPTAASATNFAGDAIGDCRTDTFSISSAQGGTPTICGVNTGQHMNVETKMEAQLGVCNGICHLRENLGVLISQNRK